MKNRAVLFLLIAFLLISNISAVEFGILGGKNTKPSDTTYGFSAGMGFLVPMVKFEAEFFKQSDTELNRFSIGLKVRKRFNNLAPYAIIGIGSEFEKFSLSFSEYSSYTFIGGGTHLFFMQFFSLRFDIRYQNFKEFNNVRLSAGIFLHL